MGPSPTTGERRLRRDAEANRQRILKAAGELFAERGIEVPLDEIVQRAGVGAGTFYRRFPDRDHLLDALFEERVRRFDETLATACEVEDAWEGLVGLLTTRFALQAADRGLKEILVARARGAGCIRQPSAETMQAISGLIERAQIQGSLRADVALTDFPLLEAAIHGVIDLTGTQAPDAWRRLLQILLDGLRTERTAPTPLPHEPLAVDQLRAAKREREQARAGSSRVAARG